MLITLGVLLLAAAALLLSLWPSRTRLPAPAHHQCELPPPRPDLHLVRLHGDGEYGVQVAAGSDCQEALQRLYGARNEAGPSRKAVAILVPERLPARSTCGVAVMIDGERVGYLAPEAVDDYQDETARRGWRGLAAMCDAVIVGGEGRPRPSKVARDDLRVQLDIRWPLAGQVDAYAAPAVRGSDPLS